jgi:septation ring formation regulator EzrA
MSDDLPADLRRVSGAILNRLGDATNVLARQMILQNAKAVQKAADRIEQLERGRVLDAKLLADTQALLDKAVVALRDALDAWDNHNKTGDMMQGHWVDDARAVLAEIEGGKKDE